MAEPTRQIDLALCSSKDLVDELARRHDAFVIAGMKFTDNRGGYRVTRYHNGHRYVCLGLLNNLESLINKEENTLLSSGEYD